MSKKHSKQTEKQLIEIVNSNNNLNRCGECGSEYPTWASWNLGVLLCGKCANCHKKVLGSGGRRGEPISKVKSLTLEIWSDSQIDHLRSIGNRAARQKWNPKKVPFPYNDGDDDGPIEAYLRDKYILGKFRFEAISDDDYDSHHGRSTPSSVRSRKNRSRSASRSIPRLSHRKLTSYELSQYASQARDILKLGYTDRDAIVESLILSKGDLNEALDILAFDAEINPSLAECPPDLPRRPPTTGASVNTATFLSTPPTTANATVGSNDWWTGQSMAQQAAQQTGLTGVAAVAPQIYQYTDPVTGQISYIDSNGQQYLDPSNPQHQQMMMPPANPQALARQQTNQNILSLYNQPTLQAQAQQGQAGQQNQQFQQQQQQQQQQQMQQMYTQAMPQTMQPQQTSMLQGMQMGYQQPQAASAQNAYYTGQVGYAPQGFQPTQQQYGN